MCTRGVDASKTLKGAPNPGHAERASGGQAERYHWPGRASDWRGEHEADSHRLEEQDVTAEHRPYESKDVQLQSGHTLRYYEWPGEGPTVVLLHGSSGYGLMWQGVADHLGDRFRIIAPDQRGHGDSDKPDGEYSANEYAEDMHDFIQALDLGPVVIGGHSLGGRVSQVFAAEYPEECLGVVLVGIHLSNFYQERDRMEAVLESAHRALVAQTEFASREEALAFARETRPYDTEESIEHRVTHNMDQVGEGYRFKYDPVRVAQSLAHQCVSLRPYAPRVKCPVVILSSTRGSEIRSPEEGQELASCWRDATVVEVEGDYLLHVVSPGPTAEALANMIDERVRA